MSVLLLPTLDRTTKNCSIGQAQISQNSISEGNVCVVDGACLMSKPAVMFSTETVVALAQTRLRPMRCVVDSEESCQIVLASWEALLLHLVKHSESRSLVAPGPRKPSGAKQYTCPFQQCNGRLYDTSGSVKEHIEKVHMVEVALSCPFKHCFPEVTYKKAIFLHDHIEQDHAQYAEKPIDEISCMLLPSWRPIPANYPAPEPLPSKIPLGSLCASVSQPMIPLPRPSSLTVPSTPRPLLHTMSPSSVQLSPLKTPLKRLIKQMDSMDSIMSLTSTPIPTQLPDFDDLPATESASNEVIPGKPTFLPEEADWVVWKRPNGLLKNVSSGLPMRLPCPVDYEPPVSILYDIFSRRVEQLQQSGHLDLTNFG